jgi:hypothetical protein
MPIPVLKAEVKLIRKEGSKDDKSQCDNIQRGSNDSKPNGTTD